MTTALAPARNRRSVSAPEHKSGRASIAPRQVHAPRPAAPVRRSKTGEFLSSFNLEKLFTLFGFAVAAFLVVVFGSDLVTGWPFSNASLLFDWNCVLCGIAMAYLSWSTLLDQIRGCTRPSPPSSQASARSPNSW